MKTKLFCVIALSVSVRLFAGTTNDQFVAHEWGTFTSVQGADGVPLEWNPFIKTDLPKFVYSRPFLPGYGRNLGAVTVAFKDAMPSFVRMETPVIYFYSEKEIIADVRVSMPQGRITEWYPRARVGPYATTNKAEAQAASRSFIEWNGLKILARDTKEISADRLIAEKGGNHYYEARETDANFVRVASPYESSGDEYERDLFYRGVGFFTGPLTLKVQDNETDLQLSTKSPEPLTDLFALTIRNGTARYQRIDQVSKEAERGVKLDDKAFAPLSDVQQQLMREMAAVLVKQGLYAKEAEAMVNTWKDQWFSEEGTRVLYLLPRSWTDQILPLTISPMASETVRVMVGRAELITPAMELTLKEQVRRYATGDSAKKAEVIAEVRRSGPGRFLEPVTRKMLGKTPTKEFAQAAWALTQEASKPAPEAEPTKKLAAF